MLATSDSGATWEPVSVDALPVSVAANGDAATVACAGGILFATTDRGTSWRRVDVGINGVPEGIGIARDERCHILFAGIVPDVANSEDTIRIKAFELFELRQRFYLSDPGPYDSSDTLGDWIVAERLLSTRTALISSVDGWRTWQADPNTERLRPMAFGVGANTFVLIDYDGTVYSRATDERAWRPKSRLAKVPWVVWVISDSTWVCPDRYKMLRTVDAGATWTSDYPPALNMVSGTCFVTEQRGFTTSGNYVGTFSVDETTDAALTWRFLMYYRPTGL